MSTTLYPAWREAAKQLIDAGTTYGSVITKLHIAKLCDLKPPKTADEKDAYDLKLLSFITSIKAQLLHKHLMLMVPDRKGRYVIIHPSEQTQYAVAEGVNNIKRELVRAADVLAHTNRELLTAEQQRVNTDAQAKLSMLAGMHKTGRKELRALVEK